MTYMGNQGGIYKTLGDKKKRQKTPTCKYEHRLDFVQLSQSRFPKTHYSHRHNTMHFHKTV